MLSSKPHCPVCKKPSKKRDILRDAHMARITAVYSQMEAAMGTSVHLSQVRGACVHGVCVCVLHGVHHHSEHPDLEACGSTCARCVRTLCMDQGERARLRERRTDKSQKRFRICHAAPVSVGAACARQECVGASGLSSLHPARVCPLRWMLSWC